MIRKPGSLLALAGATLFTCCNLASAQTPMPPCLAVDASAPATCGTTTTGLFLGNSMQGITLAPQGNIGGQQWIQFQGTDAKYGNVLPRAPASPWGGTAAYTDSIQQIFNTAPQTDTVEAIVTDNTVPPGVSNRVLQTTLVNPQNGVMQDSYLIEPSTSAPQGMLYTSRWVWLQADMGSRGPDFEQEFFEFKTPDGNSTKLGPERFQVNIFQANNSHGFSTSIPNFSFAHNSQTNYPSGALYTFMGASLAPNSSFTSKGYTAGFPLSNVAVPLGRWFRLEVAFNRLDSTGQGWMWVALTDPGSSNPLLQAGTTIFQARGAFSYADPDYNQSWTNGMNPATSANPGGYAPAAPYINRIFLHNLSYGGITRSPASPYVIKMTDMEVYTGWPASATAHPSNYN